MIRKTRHHATAVTRLDPTIQYFVNAELEDMTKGDCTLVVVWWR
jgi:hypothetical protein